MEKSRVQKLIEDAGYHCCSYSKKNYLAVEMDGFTIGTFLADVLESMYEHHEVEEIVREWMNEYTTNLLRKMNYTEKYVLVYFSGISFVSEKE